MSNSDREAFEKRYAVLDLTRTIDDPFQDYKSSGTDILWRVWQAAWAELAQEIETLRAERDQQHVFAVKYHDENVKLFLEIERLKRVVDELLTDTAAEKEAL